ncbi:hypothetical protein VMA_001958 [Vibrio mimicus VM223]|nr:hypothetical protein VMA_001958 [Vibrio mimicus VM223]
MAIDTQLYLLLVIKAQHFGIHGMNGVAVRTGEVFRVNIVRPTFLT